MLLKSSGAKKGETMESRRQETGVAGCSLTRLLGPSVPLGNKGGWRALFLLLFSELLLVRHSINHCVSHARDVLLAISSVFTQRRPITEKRGSIIPDCSSPNKTTLHIFLHQY